MQITVTLNKEFELPYPACMAAHGEFGSVGTDSTHIHLTLLFEPSPMLARKVRWKLLNSTGFVEFVKSGEQADYSLQFWMQGMRYEFYSDGGMPSAWIIEDQNYFLVRLV